PQIFPAPTLPTWNSEPGRGSQLGCGSPAHRVPPVVETRDPAPSPAGSPPLGGGGAEAARARPNAGPGQSDAAISDVGLRAAPSPRRGVGTGSQLWSLGWASRTPQAARPGGRAAAPCAPRQGRHAGPCREHEPRTARRAALHRRVRGGPLRERRTHAQFRHFPAGAARRRGLQHVVATSWERHTRSRLASCQIGRRKVWSPRVKRFREPKHERRPWRIWFLDTSKQAIGMLFIHFANVYLADLTEEDPCSLYLINFLLDATVGMLLIYVGVRAVSVLVEWQQWESLRFGEYGDPLQCGAWVGQCALYIVIMIFEKSVVFIVLLILQWKKVALLNPIENPDLKLAIVMLIVPFFVNALMFWVVDNFLMRKGRTKAKLEERGANQDSRNGSKVRYRRAASHEESESEILISADDEMEESDVEEDLRRLTPLKPAKKKKHRFGLPV
uniref:STIM activating enhancer n=4 Tax=Laurasiatheria TaxID=314145 RepID=A0A8D0R7V9_PIG